MAVDNIPWFMGVDGVEHSSELARLVAYGATGGNSGVIGRKDLRVVAFPNPVAAVYVAPGAAALVNEYPGGGAQSYLGRVTSGTNVPVTPTGTVARADLVIARVRDPQYGNYAGFNPAKPNEFDYFTIETVEGVDWNTQALGAAYPHVVLARLNIPANTAVITSSMVTDLRRKAQPLREDHAHVYLPVKDTSIADGYTSWPVYAAAPTFSVPQWATRALLKVTYSGVECTGPFSANTRGVMGNVIDDQYNVITKRTSGTDRLTYIHLSQFAIPESMRGYDVTFSVQAQRTSSGGHGEIDVAATVLYEVAFLEEAE